MNINISNILSWLIIGGLAGTLAGMLAKGRKQGLGRFLNLGVGLLGALLGGAVVRLLKIDFGMGELVLRWEDMLAAIVASLILIAAYAFLRKRRQKKVSKFKNNGMLE